MKDVFISLLNMSISATWLIAVVVLVRLCLGKAPKWIRGVLWAMVALRLVVPFAIESPISLVPDLQVRVEAPAEQASSVQDATEQVHTPPVVDMPVVNVPDDAPVVDIPSPDVLPTSPEGSTFTEFPITDEPVVDAPIVNDPVVIPDEAPEKVPVLVADEKEGVDIAFLVAVIWGVGVLAMAAYCVVSYWRLKLKLKEAVRIDEGVYESGWIKSAFVLGIIKPIVYIPRALPLEEREYVLAHERVHISRFDYIFKPLGFLILALHWFNPMVWLAYILYCRDMELACDEKVIKGYTVEQVKSYSRALVACGEGHSHIFVCPIAFGEVGIKARVKNILNYRKPGLWIVIGAVAVCVIVAVCFLTVRDDPKETADSTEGTETTESTESTEGTDGTDTTDPTEPSEPDSSTEPTEPDGSTEPSEPGGPDDTTDPTGGEEPTVEPVEPIDLKIVGTMSRPVGAKDIGAEPALLFSVFGSATKDFETVTTHVANSVDSTHSYMIDVFDSYDEFNAFIELINEGRSYNNIELPDYGEEFFRENILIVSYYQKPNRISTGGGELCFEFDHYMSILPYGMMEPDIVYPPGYYGVAVKREDIEGVDTLSLCSRHLYKGMPEQVPAKPREYTLSLIDSPVSGEKGEHSVNNGNYFDNWGFNHDGIDEYVPVKQKDRTRSIVSIIFEDEFWFKWYTSSGRDRYNEDAAPPAVFSKYDGEFFSEKALIMLSVPGKPYECEVVFDGKKNGKLYFTAKTCSDTVFSKDHYYSSWSFVEVDRSLLTGVSEVGVYVEMTKWDHSYDLMDDCSYGMHDIEYVKNGCGYVYKCKKCGVVELSGGMHEWADATCTEPAACTKCGQTNGDPLGHRNLTMAGCTGDGICTICGVSVEKATGHEFVNNVCTRRSCDCSREKTDPSVKYVCFPGEDTVIDIVDGTLTFDGTYEIVTVEGKKCIKIDYKADNCKELILGEMTKVRGYVDGKLTDIGVVEIYDEEWDETSRYIPYTEDGEYLIDIYYGDPTMPYMVTVSFPVILNYSPKY